MSAICDTHKKKVDFELLYNSVHRKFDQLEIRCGRENQYPAEGGLQDLRLSSSSSDQLERRCWNEEHVSERLGTPGRLLSSQGERERNTIMAIRVGVNMLQFCSFSNSLSL